MFAAVFARPSPCSAPSRRPLLLRAGALLAVFAVGVGVGPTAALTPISPEQILCTGDYIFAGRVTAVKNKDCRLSPSPETCKQDRSNDVELAITVTRVMGARKSVQGLRVGQTITAQSSTTTSPHNTAKFSGQGSLAFRADYDSLLPDAWLQAAYVGQDFIFSGNPTRASARLMVWPSDQADWARDAMTRPEKLYGGDCALPL